MRSPKLTVLGLSAFLLTGCVGGGFGGPTGGLSPEQIEEIKKTAATVCRFVPTTATILSLFDAGGKYANYAAIAQQVCDAVSKVTYRRGKVSKPVVVVNGKRIVIDGKRV
jgi:hypothetical protein